MPRIDERQSRAAAGQHSRAAKPTSEIPYQELILNAEIGPLLTNPDSGWSVADANTFMMNNMDGLFAFIQFLLVPACNILVREW